MLIWPEAGRAQNSMAAVWAEGGTICVSMRRHFGARVARLRLLG